MARKSHPIDRTRLATIQVIEALTQPELRRQDRMITELNRLNGELLRVTNNMGFAYAGQVFVPSEFHKIAGKNYTASGVAWPQLHMSLWDRAADLLKDKNDSANRLAQVRQYIGVILSAPELDDYGKRNCIPDYIVSHMDHYKDIPRTAEIDEVLKSNPRLKKHFKMVEDTIAVLAAGQLIY